LTSSLREASGRTLAPWAALGGGIWTRVALAEAPDRLLGMITGIDEFEFTYRVRRQEASPLPDHGGGPLRA
jgi:hypothetical protein